LWSHSGKQPTMKRINSGLNYSGRDDAQARNKGYALRLLSLEIIPLRVKDSVWKANNTLQHLRTNYPLQNTLEQILTLLFFPIVNLPISWDIKHPLTTT
jgi:hypothetical protein